MANIIAKGHYECEYCKCPWLIPRFERRVLSSDKSKVLREEVTYYCDGCGAELFTIDERIDENR